MWSELQCDACVTHCSSLVVVLPAAERQDRERREKARSGEITLRREIAIKSEINDRNLSQREKHTGVFRI